MINFLTDDLLGLDGYSCQGTKLFALFESAKFIIRVIQIAVPFALVIWGSLDWFKALIAHDEKEMRMKRKPFVARLIAAMIILLFPWLIEIISSIVAGNSDAVNIFTCYHEATPRIDFSNMEINMDDGSGDGIIGGFRGKTKNRNRGSDSNTSNSTGENDSNDSNSSEEKNRSIFGTVVDKLNELLSDDEDGNKNNEHKTNLIDRTLDTLKDSFTKKGND